MRKIEAAGPRRFEPDDLYLRPECSGTWFPAFDGPSHVTTTADYNPGLPVHLAVDPGVHDRNIQPQFAG